MGCSPAVVGVIQRHVILVPVCLSSVGRRGKTPTGFEVIAHVVLQSEEQTASGVPGAIRRMWFGDGQSVLRMVTDQLGKKSGLSSCFLRGVSFFLILTSALPFLANVTDLPPLIGSQGFPFWAYHPLFLPGLWPEKIRPYRSWIRPWK